MSDLKEQLFELNIMSKKSVGLYHKFALSMGISDSCLGILYALSESKEEYSQNDLCNEWSIPKQTINSSVDVLKKKGLVELLAIPGTRNKKNIKLTAAGEKFVEINISKLQQAELSALSALSPQERDIYIRLNNKYNESLGNKINSLILLGDE